jgi:galactose mutarotase-like enzyme|tara:strand:- start:157 stop:582 length:426 start_codon:yes stop_codon:yes gene_type:complete
MPIAPGIHPYYAAATGDDVIFETRSDEANDNHQLYLAVRLEDSLKSLVEDNSGVRKFRVVGNPDLHLKGHGLETTQLKIGSNQPLRITADLESFNRMTLWRKHADSTFICLEPAYVKNGLNGQPISIPSGEIWSTVFKISH